MRNGHVCQKILPGRESNPGRPRDRREYSPLYYRGLRNCSVRLHGDACYLISLFPWQQSTLSYFPGLPRLRSGAKQSLFYLLFRLSSLVPKTTVLHKERVRFPGEEAHFLCFIFKVFLSRGVVRNNQEFLIKFASKVELNHSDSHRLRV